MIEKLEITDKNQVLQRSFFNKDGYPKPFFKESMDKEEKIIDTLRKIFPYEVKFLHNDIEKTDAINMVSSKDIWIAFYGSIWFSNEDDAKVFETVLKLIK
jgi:hypothetical protein